MNNNRACNRCLLALCFVAFAVLAHAQGTTSVGIDWVLLIDTSGSMAGLVPGSQNIFPDVKTSLKGFVHRAVGGDAFYVYTFDTTARFAEVIPITESSDKSALASSFDGPTYLPAGRCTRIADAILMAVARANKLLNAARSTQIVLFTDGMETCLDAGTTQLSQLNIERHEIEPHTFFVVWLGGALDVQAVREKLPKAIADRVTVLVRPHAREIALLADEIREHLPPRIAIAPAVIDFGYVRPGGMSGRRVIRVTTDRSTTVRLTLDGGDTGPLRLDLDGNTQLSPGENTLRLAIAATDDAPHRVIEGKVEVRLAERDERFGTEHRLLRLTLGFQVVPSSFWVPGSWVKPLLVTASISMLLAGLLFFLNVRRGPRRAPLESVDDMPVGDGASSSARSVDVLTASRVDFEAEERIERLRRQIAADLQRLNAAIEQVLAESSSRERALGDLRRKRERLLKQLEDLDAADLPRHQR